MKNNFLLREVAGEYLLVPLGESGLTFNSIVTFNETGAFIWKKLEEDLTEAEIADALTREYNVAYQQALTDVKQLIGYLKEKNVL